jgi:thiamine biosynthesis lipoprotein
MSQGLKNYYIEIGGELIVRGKNREGEDWRIGIDTPIENQKNRELENVLSLSNKAVATSGNYRKFYEVNGIKYSHTLNPKTGWPVRHSLLSATVVTDNCADADAYATAFMVLGVDSALQLIEEKKMNIEVYLIYTNAEGEMAHAYTPGFEKYLD